MLLAFLNYRDLLMTLSVNFVITGSRSSPFAFLFFATAPWAGRAVYITARSFPTTACPTAGSVRVAALQFGMWYYLGIEGTRQSAEESARPRRRSRSGR